MRVCDVCKERATEHAVVAADGIEGKSETDFLFGLPFRWLDLCDTHNKDLVENWGGFR